MIRRKRPALIMLITALSLLALTALSSSGVEARTLVFGHNDPVVSIANDAAHLFAELVEEYTDGAFSVDVFPANQLGTNRDLIEQTQQGVMDFTMGGIGNLGDIKPEYNMMMAMFVFNDQRHVRNVVQGDIGKRLAEQLLPLGLRMVSQTWDRFPRQIVADRVIVEPGDMRGLVIRAGYPGAEVPLRALGASPTRIPLAEMYTALSQGVIGAVEMPWAYILGESLYEVVDYVILTDNTYATRFLAMSDALYQSITEEQREAIFRAAEEAGIYNNQNTWAEVENYKEALRGYGMQFIEPNREAMVNIVKDSIDELEEIWGIHGLYAEVHGEQYTEPENDYQNTAPPMVW